MRNTLRLTLILILVGFSLSSCNSTKIIGTYKSPDIKSNYDDIFVVGLVSDQLTDKNVEADLVDMLQARGIYAQAIKGTFNPDIELTEAKKKEIGDNLRSKGFDSVLTFALVSVDEDERYVPGTYNTGYYPTRYPYYGSYWGYYGYYAPQVYEPGYYTKDVVYTMEAALYDLETGKLVWSARSETLNPTNVQNFAREYAETVSYRMLKDRVVQRKK